MLKQQDLQQALVLLGASKADIYRLTTAASAWAKNTLSDILGWHVWSSWHWTADWCDNAWDHTDWVDPATSRRNHCNSRHTGESPLSTVRWSMHRGIHAKLSVAIAISTGVLCFHSSRWRLALAKTLSPLKDRSSCVFLLWVCGYRSWWRDHSLKIVLTRSSPEKRCSDPVESSGRGTHRSLIDESDPLNPAELKDTNCEFSPHRAQFGCYLVEFANHKRSDCVLFPHEGVRKWGAGVLPSLRLQDDCPFGWSWGISTQWF